MEWSNAIRDGLCIGKCNLGFGFTTIKLKSIDKQMDILVEK